MMIADLLVAAMIALVLSVILVVGLRVTGPWTTPAAFFAILFLATWAGGLWLAPVGKPLKGIYLLSFLAAGMIFALLLAAAAPSRGIRSPKQAYIQKKSEEEAREAALGVFFWILVVVLVVAIAARYLFPVAPHLPL